MHFQIDRIFLGQMQGDQIGRIFAEWAIVFFGQFFENYGSAPKFWAIHCTD
jgi:hypothetical protein